MFKTRKIRNSHIILLCFEDNFGRFTNLRFVSTVVRHGYQHHFQMVHSYFIAVIVTLTIFQTIIITIVLITLLLFWDIETYIHKTLQT